MTLTPLIGRGGHIDPITDKKDIANDFTGYYGRRQW